MSDTNLELAKVEGLAPATMSEAMSVAKLLSSGSFVPDAFRGKPADVLAAIMLGADLGMGPVTALQSIYVVHGKPALYGDAPLAICRNHAAWGYAKHGSFGEEGTDGFGYWYYVHRKGEPEVAPEDWPHVGKRFTVADAKTAKLWMKKGPKGGDTPWVTHWKDMLFKSARWRELKEKFPDALKGLGLREELEFIEPARDVNVVEVPEAKSRSAAMAQVLASREEAKSAPVAEQDSEKARVTDDLPPGELRDTVNAENVPIGDVYEACCQVLEGWTEDTKTWDDMQGLDEHQCKAVLNHMTVNHPALKPF